MNYTIVVEGPFTPQVNRGLLTKNVAGQLVAFDGKTTIKAALNAALRLVEHCGDVAVFKGKDIGKLIAHWHDGKQMPILPDFRRCEEPWCTYCGNA